MSEKILFISYVFPPTGGAGIQRTVKLVKYFHKLGWEPFVLTAKNPSVPVFDYEIQKDVPASVRVFKSFSIEPPYALKRRLWSKTVAKKDIKDEENRKDKNSGLKQLIIKNIKLLTHVLMLPDPQRGWNFFTLKKAKKIIKKYRIKYVFISSPPFSSLLLVEELSKTGVKVVADFRDEWTEFYLKSYDFHQRDEYTKNKIIDMEDTVIKSAALITMATQSFVNNYQQKYKNYADKIKLLTNGFDVDDFIGYKKENKSEKYTITYTGTVFNVTTARYLLEVIEELIRADKLPKNKIYLNFIGRITDEEEEFFKNFRYPEILNRTGYISHNDSVKYLYNSDLLVVIVDDLDGSDRIIAAKVFEYINTEIPVLALVPENGEIAKIVKETKTGVVISNRNKKEMSETLLKFFNNNVNINPDRNEIDRYSREKISQKLIHYLMDL